MPDNTEKKAQTKKGFSPDWLVQGVLTKFGDIFDRLTGRSWKPSSSLATSELTERLKKLLDQEARDLGEKGKFVPHNLKLKMQWDKFSTDSEKALNTLQKELLIAAVDHINDHRYQTYEPINLEVKPDYFTEGVKLIASFDKIGAEENEVAVNVTVPEIKVGDYMPESLIEPESQNEIFTVEFSLNGKPKRIELEFSPGTRRSVGRAGQNDLIIDDNSVSKMHAALVLTKGNQLQIADTGSTNGTFINDRRISYGKAMTISEADKIKFGTVEVLIKFPEKEEIIEPEIVENEEIIEPEIAEKPEAETEVLLNSKELIPPESIAAIDKDFDKDLKPDTEEKSDSLTGNNLEPEENSDLTKQGIVFDFENETAGKQK